MLTGSIQTAGMVCIFVASLCCVIVGDKPVRLATAASLAALVTSLMVQTRDSTFQPGVFVVDLVFMAILLLLALFSRRRWVAFASAFQILSVATHLALISLPLARTVYFTVLAMWTYLVVVSISVGAALVLNERLSRRRAHMI